MEQRRWLAAACQPTVRDLRNSRRHCSHRAFGHLCLCAPKAACLPTTRAWLLKQEEGKQSVLDEAE